MCSNVQDVVLVLQQAPHPVFEREGDDLIMHIRIGLSLALCEGKIDVPHLDGRTLRVPLKEVRPSPTTPDRHIFLLFQSLSPSFPCASSVCWPTLTSRRVSRNDYCLGVLCRATEQVFVP